MYYVMYTKRQLNTSARASYHRLMNEIIRQIESGILQQPDRVRVNPDAAKHRQSLIQLSSWYIFFATGGNFARLINPL